MKLKEKYSQNEIESINKAIREQNEFYKKSIFEVYAAPMPSALKPANVIQQEQQAAVDAMMQFLQQDIKVAIELFQSECPQKDQIQLNKIFDKIKSSLNVFADKPVSNLTEEDCEFLEELTKIALARGAYSEGSCMYRFLSESTPCLVAPG